MKKGQEGFSALTVLFVLVVLVILASAASYYILRNAGNTPTIPYRFSASLAPTGSQGSISESTNTNMIERELNDTTLNSPESDLKDLDTSASSL